MFFWYGDDEEGEEPPDPLGRVYFCPEHETYNGCRAPEEDVFRREGLFVAFDIFFKPKENENIGEECEDGGYCTDDICGEFGDGEKSGIESGSGKG